MRLALTLSICLSRGGRNMNNTHMRRRLVSENEVISCLPNLLANSNTVLCNIFIMTLPELGEEQLIKSTKVG